MSGGPRVVVVDHHDSYAWSLVDLVASVTGELPAVVEHDHAGLDDLAGFSHVVLSPGPGSPEDPRDFALGREVLRSVRVPVLGVCLGMQGIVTTYGGRVTRQRPAHGEVSAIEHDGHGVFEGLPQRLRAVRYHSLAVASLPACLEATARAEDGVVMGVRHRELPVEGVQFHPESALTEHGESMIRTFLSW